MRPVISLHAATRWTYAALVADACRMFLLGPSAQE